MPPTVKENEIQVGGQETAQRPSSTATMSGDTGIKQQPVALEVPVSVNGARTVEGSDKREPFSESTKTVLVFGSGAVIRLSSSVAPGQLLFLTNERTKKEVVCQVVKSKNYRNVSGYVELEFTESVVGFWGMRFPCDRIGSAPRPATPAPLAPSSPSASGSPVAPRPAAPTVAAPASIVAPSVLVPKPAAPTSVLINAAPKISEVKFNAPTAPMAQFPAAPAVEDHADQKPVAPVAKLSSSLSSSFDPAAPLTLPIATPFVPAVPVAPAPPVATIPEIRFNPPPENLAPAAPVLFDSPRPSESQASFLEPPKAVAASPVTVNATIAPAAFELKPFVPAAVPPPPPSPNASDSETEALKQHTARLQEQLSSLLFSVPAAALPVVPPVAPPVVATQNVDATPVFEPKELAETASKVLEFAQAPELASEPAKLPEPVKRVMTPATASLDEEELQIPAWLAPLARNAAAPTSTQELIEREKAKRLAEQQTVEEIPSESVVLKEESHIAELPLPTFGDALPIDEEKSFRASRSKSSNKGVRIAAIAAGVLLLAGGAWWYTRPQSGGVHAGAAPASSVQASVASLPGTSSPSQPSRNAAPQSNVAAQSNPVTQNNTESESNSASNSISVVPVAPSTRSSQPASNPANGGASGTSANSTQPLAVSEKKSILGEVHLATPKVTPTRNAQNGSVADPGIVLANDDQPESSNEALNGGLAGGSNQPAAPAAPLPVGGDVVSAKQISSVPPVYPSLARNQRVSGNVVIDALIDANGRVSTMKVVSGPTLLHQAAMEALKQWKYQPATLDGKPTAMHLSVTIQFRLQ
jgi:TonB family protein